MLLLPTYWLITNSDTPSCVKLSHGMRADSLTVLAVDTHIMRKREQAYCCPIHERQCRDLLANLVYAYCISSKRQFCAQFYGKILTA